MKREEIKRSVSKLLCKERTQGVVCDCFSDEDEYSKVLMVEYTISDKHLTLYEKLMSKRVEGSNHLGMLPRKSDVKPAIDGTLVGRSVTVMYSKFNPLRAYILENEGFHYSMC